MSKEENKYENPVDWCQRMVDNAATGEDAYKYFQLKQMWEERQKELEQKWNAKEKVDV